MAASTQFAVSGIDELDEVLGGGFPRGQFTLIRGQSGAGKTTLCLQFLLEGVRRGESCLYIGTSETDQEIRRVAASHGWSLDGVRVHHHASAPTGVEQTVLHPAELELPRTMDAMLAVVDEVAPSRLVIDSLAEIRVLAREEMWYRRQLMAMKQHFADGRCTVLLVEIPQENAGLLASVVSGVVELEQVTPAYGPDRRRLRIAKIRGQPFRTGFHDFKIKKGGLQVFPRLVAADHRQQYSRELISTGMARMDEMMDGGVARGIGVLLYGPSGTGKSLVATQLAVASAERGEPVAYYVFDERLQTLFQRAEGVGLPLKKHVDAGTIQVRQVDPVELSSGEFSHGVRQRVEHDGIRLLVIDSLNGYAYAMPEERLLSVHLHELSSYLSEQKVTSVFTSTQHGLVFDLTGQPFDVSYIADTVLLFRHFEFGGRLHKAVSVYKNRAGRHETTIRELRISGEGIGLGEPLEQFQGVLKGAPEFMGDKLNGYFADAE